MNRNCYICHKEAKFTIDWYLTAANTLKLPVCDDCNTRYAITEMVRRNHLNNGIARRAK